MNTRSFKITFVVLALFIGFGNVNAQKKKGGGTRGSSSRAGSGYGSSSGGSGYGSTGSGYGGTTGGGAKTTKPAAGGSTTTSGGSGYGTTGGGSGYGTSGGGSGYGNSGAKTNGAAAAAPVQINQSLPVKFVKGSGSGIGDSITPSLRNDAAIDRQLVKDRNPLVYEHIREDDAVYRQRVWREIDTREKMNLPFRNAANEDNGNQRFISILMYAIQAGDITVFNGDDDRFTTPMTKEEVSKIVTGGIDTVAHYDMNGEPDYYEARQRMIEPDSIYRFRLKEEWIFDKESSRMFVRILGIAPIMTQYTSSGISVGDRILFWAYYPDLRPTLAKYEVFNGKNFAGRMSWEELFESRFFSSYIVKSSLDNPYDRSLKEYIKDPLFRLLEGENIKEKIFNYEQDLWSY